MIFATPIRGRRDGDQGASAEYTSFRRIEALGGQKRRHRPRNADSYFDAVNKAAQPHLRVVLRRLLPDGVIRGAEFVALNPPRKDKKLGSFKINLRTGRWADWAADAKGGDVISLVAYLYQRSQIEAALRLAHMLGLDTEGRRNRRLRPTDRRRAR
jgi:hypothetical protein